jgi:hypothetical protein
MWDALPQALHYDHAELAIGPAQRLDPQRPCGQGVPVGFRWACRPGAAAEDLKEQKN